MAKDTLPTGYTSWKEYYDYVVSELSKYKNNKPEYGTEEYKKYYNLQHEEITARYAVEDENKAAKKAALEAQAKENGFGPKEMKVVNTMTRSLNSIEKWKTNGEKAVKKGIISKKTYNSIIDYINTAVKMVDDAWELIKDSNNDSSKFIRKNMYIVSGIEDGKCSIHDFVSHEEYYKLFDVKPDIENAVGSYVENLFKRAEAKVMDTRVANRTKAKDDKEAHYQSIRRTFYGPIETGKVPTMKVFLDNWIDRYIKYYTDEERKNNYYEAYQEAKKEFEEYRRTSSRDSYKKYYELSDKQSEAWQNYYPFTKSVEEIKSDAERSADLMERKFISTVYDYSGEISDVKLKFGISGDLNGIVTGNNGKKWKVETITAGGYNIQRFHVRTIVHEVK